MGEQSRWAPGGEPHAIVTQESRRTWSIVIQYTENVTMGGATLPRTQTVYQGEGPWIAWGSRERADRKAARILARFLRRAQYPREEHTVRG